MAHSREGITLDLITRTLRNSLLSPFIALPIAIGLSWQPARTRLFEYVHAEASSTALVVAYLLAALSVTLSLNDYLNDGFANNWVRASDWDWNSEIVVITGGSSGIGEHVARQLLAKNIQTTIVILDYVPMTWAAPAKSKVHYYQVDLSNSSNISTITQRIRDEVGHPTVLVNNAGLSRGFTVMDGSYMDVEVTIRTNLVAPFLLIKEFIPQMVSRNHGHIINISSMSALIPPARVADYAATKAGLVALHEALQLELKDVHGAPKVRLSLAILSFVRTPLFKGETHQSNFLFPLMHVETVADSIVDTLYSGLGRTIYLPGIMRYVAILKGGPDWFFRIIRNGSNNLGVDFKGRQRIDPKTGRLGQAGATEN